MTRWLALGLIVSLCLGVGALGGWLTDSSDNLWYQSLLKPFWTPPSWVFAPIWTVLYLSMGVSMWLIWERLHHEGLKFLPYVAFGFQLFLNFLWTHFFFGLHNPALSLIDIILLWAAITATIVIFWSVYKPAAWLLFPYWLWVAYAATLNAGVWWLNRA